MMMKKCLVADNNQLYLEFFTDILGAHGYEVLLASDGLVALETARTTHIDLFILDFIMPKIDGLRLARYLKEMPEYGSVPVIMITAAALESVKWDDDGNYADLLVAKGPFNRMTEIFNEILPNIAELMKTTEKKVYGLQDVFPRQIVKELLRIEVNHSVIFHNLAEGVLELDEENVIVFANKPLCEIIGKAERDVVGRKLADIFNFDSSPELRECCQEVLSTHAKDRNATVITLGDKAVHFSCYSIMNENAFIGSFVIVQDVTIMRNKIQEIGALFNITQAFLSDLPYQKVLDYVVFEMKRLIRATNVTLLLSNTAGLDSGEISSMDRRLDEGTKKKITFWTDKIKGWQQEGLISLKNVSRMNKVNFDKLPIVWAPLVFHNRSLGTVLGFKSPQSDFLEEEMRLFEAVSNQMAVYIANVEFFSRALSSEEEVQKVKHDVENMVKTQSEDVFNQNRYLRWEERNKKIILQQITENISRSLANFKGFTDLFDRADEGTRAGLRESISQNFSRLNRLREEIALLNKLGSREEAEIRMFDMSMLIRAVKEWIGGIPVHFPDNVPVFQKLGDHDKLAFVFAMVIRELYVKTGGDISVSFELAGERLSILVHFGYDLLFGENSNDPDASTLFNCLSADGWEDFDNSIYYFYWHMKSIMEVFNGVAGIRKSGNEGVMTLAFLTNLNEGEKS